MGGGATTWKGHSFRPGCLETQAGTTVTGRTDVKGVHYGWRGHHVEGSLIFVCTDTQKTTKY